MKKIFALLLSAALVCLFAAGCGGSDRPGYYVLDSITDGNATMDSAELAELGMDGYLVLQEDGSGFIKLCRDLRPLSWEEGGVIVDGKFEALTLDADRLTLTENGSTLCFTRSQEQAPAAPDHYTRSLLNVSGRFDWIAFTQDGQTYRPETLGEGTEGYVLFYGDNTALFSVKVGDMSAANTDALTVEPPTGRLVDSIGYEIEYDYDGSTLLLTIDGTDYLYAAAGAEAPAQGEN